MMLGIRHQYEVRTAGANPHLVQRFKRKIRKDIAIHHRKGRITEVRQRLNNAARSFKGLALSGDVNAYAPATAIVTKFSHLLAQMRRIDHEIGEACFAQALDMVRQ